MSEVKRQTNFDPEEGVLLLTSMIVELDLDKDNFMVSTIVDAEMEDKAVVGLNTTYRDPINDSTYLFVISDMRYPIIPVEINDILKYDVLNDDDLNRTMNLFGSHPDKNIIKQFSHLTQLYSNSGYEIRAIPWRDLQPILASDIDPDTIDGATYPILHMTSIEDKETILLMVSPYFNK